MNLKVYYRNFSSRVASKWTILAIDICLVLISMLLACILQFRGDSIIYKASLYIWMIFFSLSCNLCLFSIFRTYVGVIRFSSFVDIYRVFISLTISYGILSIGNFCWSTFGLGETLPNGIIFIAYIFNFTFMVCLRILVKMLHEALSFDDRHCVNVFIYGFRGTGVNIAKSMRVSRNNHYRVCGFISDEPWMIGKHTMGCRVYANDNMLFEHLKRKNVQTVVVTPDKLVDLESSGVMERMLVQNIHVMTVPPLSDCLDDGIIKDIHIEDWLRREPIQADIRKIAGYIEGHRILVTGAAGAVGREIVHQLAALNPYLLILVDQAESPLYDIQLELSDHWKNLEVKVLVADVVNRSRMEAIFKQYMPQLIFHAAAYKNISMLEDYASEALQVNVLGTKNIADLAVKYKVYKCMMISTDHAFSPTHVMGYSKRLAEIYMQGLSRKIKKKKHATQLFITRFADVYPEAPRSLMTLPEACLLILEVGNLGENGGIYVFDDDSAQETEATCYEKVRRSKEDIAGVDVACKQIDSLVEKCESSEPLTIINEMKKIISCIAGHSIEA